MNPCLLLSTATIVLVLVLTRITNVSAEAYYTCKPKDSNWVDLYELSSRTFGHVKVTHDSLFGHVDIMHDRVNLYLGADLEPFMVALAVTEETTNSRRRFLLHYTFHSIDIGGIEVKYWNEGEVHGDRVAHDPFVLKRRYHVLDGFDRLVATTSSLACMIYASWNAYTRSDTEIMRVTNGLSELNICELGHVQSQLTLFPAPEHPLFINAPTLVIMSILKLVGDEDELSRSREYIRADMRLGENVRPALQHNEIGITIAYINDSSSRA
jgi:hypothetical protein